jgi:hypothetical protein
MSFKDFIYWPLLAFMCCYLAFWVLLFFGVSQDSMGSIYVVIVILVVIYAIYINFRNKKYPGGNKAAIIQGIWVLNKHLKYDLVMKKYELVPVENKKSYFEFKGDQFRTGDFDEKHKQMPADFSKFSVVGDNLILESGAMKKASWKWAIVPGQGLELTAETADGNKSKYYFFQKNWF